jgi:hypothetical protein
MQIIITITIIIIFIIMAMLLNLDGDSGETPDIVTEVHIITHKSSFPELGIMDLSCSVINLTFLWHTTFT